MSSIISVLLAISLLFGGAAGQAAPAPAPAPAPAAAAVVAAAAAGQAAPATVPQAVTNVVCRRFNRWADGADWDSFSDDFNRLARATVNMAAREIDNSRAWMEPVKVALALAASTSVIVGGSYLLDRFLWESGRATDAACAATAHSMLRKNFNWLVDSQQTLTQKDVRALSGVLCKLDPENYLCSPRKQSWDMDDREECESVFAPVYSRSITDALRVGLKYDYLCDASDAMTAELRRGFGLKSAGKKGALKLNYRCQSDVFLPNNEQDKLKLLVPEVEKSIEKLENEMIRH